MNFILLMAAVRALTTAELLQMSKEKCTFKHGSTNLYTWDANHYDSIGVTNQYFITAGNPNGIRNAMIEWPGAMLRCGEIPDNLPVLIELYPKMSNWNLGVEYSGCQGYSDSPTENYVCFLFEKVTSFGQDPDLVKTKFAGEFRKHFTQLVDRVRNFNTQKLFHNALSSATLAFNRLDEIVILDPDYAQAIKDKGLTVSAKPLDWLTRYDPPARTYSEPLRRPLMICTRRP